MTNRKAMFIAIAAGVAAFGSAPSLAGEVKGTGEQVDANGRSICKFSGLNDPDPPEGRTQTYGQEVRTGRSDPTDFDPDDLFSLHPGWFCDPNNFDARDIPL